MHVIAFVALGLPIVSLLMLYGGLNPVNIFFVYAGTAAVVVFVAGCSILISIMVRRPRDAILATYFLEHSGCWFRLRSRAFRAISKDRLSGAPGHRLADPDKSDPRLAGSYIAL